MHHGYHLLFALCGRASARTRVSQSGKTLTWLEEEFDPKYHPNAMTTGKYGGDYLAVADRHIDAMRPISRQRQSTCFSRNRLPLNPVFHPPVARKTMFSLFIMIHNALPKSLW